MITQKNEYKPDYIVSPGEILDEVLESRGMKKIDFAKRCGRSTKTISQILSGEAPITPELAIRFQRVLGSPSSLWNNLEANYRLLLAKKQEAEELEKEVSWASGFPINELVKRTFFEKPTNETDMVSKVLNFFGVGSVDSWNENYAEPILNLRESKAYKSDKKALAAWLRIGEIKAQNVDCNPYDKIKFRNALNQIRSLIKTEPETFEPKIEKLCCDSGVVVVFEPEFKKIHLSGLTRWINKDKALIMLSLRHKTDDHLWFTFFHEAAHILLHGKKLIFIDCSNDELGDENLEDEANKFAANLLIPSDEYKDFIETDNYDENSIKRFAKKLDISPGIVVGRLQKEKRIPFSRYNHLKKRFEFKYE
ncbi:MAG: HigA family addiction module antidote protein [Candidatus Lokiarchaeota archaeon]|nr:HigA family addiction module antidote protein [Candidatus Lokiarchaeota archaeon]